MTPRAATPLERCGRFRKLPVVIDAYRWKGEGDLNQLATALDVSWSYRNLRENSNGQLEIPTLEGIMLAMPGDWIIKGVKGELYPCKPDIFEATYEPQARAPSSPLVGELLHQVEVEVCRLHCLLKNIPFDWDVVGKTDKAACRAVAAAIIALAQDAARKEDAKWAIARSAEENAAAAKSYRDEDIIGYGCAGDAFDETASHLRAMMVKP